MKKSIFKNHIGELVAAIVIGLLEVLALSLFYKDSLAFWFASFGNVLLLIGAWIVFSALFFVLFRLFLFLMDRLVPAKKKGRKQLLLTCLEEKITADPFDLLAALADRLLSGIRFV